MTKISAFLSDKKWKYKILLQCSCIILLKVLHETANEVAKHRHKTESYRRMQKKKKKRNKE